MISLEQLTAIKSRLANENIGGSMLISIHIRGEIQKDNGLEVEFTINGTSFDTQLVEGGDINSVVDEFIHRYRWSQANRAKLLEAPKEDAL